VAGSSHENGFSRVRAEADEDSEVNDPTEFGRVLTTRERSQHDFNSVQTRGKQVSLADLVIVGGRDAVEHAARSARHHVEVAFIPGSTDESQGPIDAECFVVLGPKFDTGSVTPWRTWRSLKGPRTRCRRRGEAADLVGAWSVMTRHRDRKTTSPVRARFVVVAYVVSLDRFEGTSRGDEGLGTHAMAGVGRHPGRVRRGLAPPTGTPTRRAGGSTIGFPSEPCAACTRGSGGTRRPAARRR